EVKSVAAHLSILQLQATALLEKSWEVIKELEAQYLRNPLLQQVFGQELVVLPGMDEALALNAVRELYDSKTYDYLVFDGCSSQTTLRMWGLPENLDWYIRRFQKILQASELAQALSPFIQPIASAILNISGSQESLNQPVDQVRSLLDRGRSAVQSPDQVLGFLVTTGEPDNIQRARYLWGNSQQIGLSVGGVFAFLEHSEELPTEAFQPLSVHLMPAFQNKDWQPLMAAVPALEVAIQQAPAPVVIHEVEKQVRLFLPGFTKGEIALTQYGPEVTVTVGDQRRNLFLPDSLKNRAVQGAKFQEDYLILSF
ncbi:MAG: ArsA family ATPase, partial [Leptolyngbya sp. SIO1D8]|nr:ArsA family ATPase [Leptolyngbya sp. SIO1D8]